MLTTTEDFVSPMTSLHLTKMTLGRECCFQSSTLIKCLISHVLYLKESQENQRVPSMQFLRRSTSPRHGSMSKNGDCSFRQFQTCLETTRCPLRRPSTWAHVSRMRIVNDLSKSPTPAVFRSFPCAWLQANSVWYPRRPRTPMSGLCQHPVTHLNSIHSTQLLLADFACS